MGKTVVRWSDGVGLFNLGPQPETVTANFADLKLNRAYTVRDLWRQKDLGIFNGTFAAQVPAHGVVLVKIAGIKNKGKILTGSSSYQTPGESVRLRVKRK